MDDHERARRDVRMQQDAKMVQSPMDWPVDVLHMKTQPWIDGPREFGFIRANNLNVVVNKDPQKLNDCYASVSELVEKWSVD